MITGPTASTRTARCSIRSRAITTNRACRRTGSRRRNCSQPRRWICRRSEAIRVKPPAFAYHVPETLAEAIALLSRNGNARVLAGGQTLMPMLNLRIASPDHLVDLGRIKELAFIREERGEIAFGAM